MQRLVISGLISLALNSAASAQTRQLDAHEHGVGRLDIAVEGQTVQMELRAPGADILGFEHAPTSDEDKQQLAQAIATLEAPLELFVPPAAAGCSVSETWVELVLEEHDEHNEHADHDEHAGEDHDTEEHASEAGHSELHGSYTISCTEPTALTVLDMMYFETFRNADRLAVQLISAQGAMALEATRKAPSVDLEGML